MEATELHSRLEANGRTIIGALQDISSAESTWKPTPDRWSLVEIVNHLADEEDLDFRTRLRLISENANTDWPPFDLITPAEDGTYASRDLPASVDRFASERARSLSWLESIGSIDTNTLYAGRGSDRIPLRAGDLMSSWIAHDYFHLRQIVRIRWDYLASDQTEFSPLYAGTE